MYKALLSFCIVLMSGNLFTQVPYTANDTIPVYNGFFRAGTNLGEYSGFTDELLAELAAGNANLGFGGLSLKALRPGLFESFLYEYGYDARIDAFDTYDALGLKDNTLIVGFPAPEHQDLTEYCAGIPSTLFSNLYTDIWDNGENGTPVNDDNHYALYIYQTASLYKDYVKFWEIWNEPGFDYTENRGWLPPGSPNNWWENNPDPCDYKLRAPIFHYVRLLRISYEVIKTVDPEAYIAVSGVGYPSFLDAILRNTDNPNDGTITTDYPLKGGAYFDVMGFHSYPHFDGSLRYWDNNIMDFAYTRHSDAAAEGILMQQDTFQGVLNNYGYDGDSLPRKHWIITEINLPRKPFGDYIGSVEAQRNFMIKKVVTCMQNGFLQSHVYKLAEDTEYDEAFFEFDLMGLYQKLDIQDGYFQTANEAGIAYKTAAELLFEKTHDPDRTAMLNLPSGIKGGAFKDEDENYLYVLWAETTIDNSEEASAVFSFPSGLGIDQLTQRDWDYGKSRESSLISSNEIPLNGTPVFLTESTFSFNVAIGCTEQSVQFNNQTSDLAVTWQWIFEEGIPSSSTQKNPLVSYTTAGIHSVTLKSFDANGNLISKQSDSISITESPTSNFTYTINGPLISFTNTSSYNSESFIWNFGDGTSSTKASPKHLFLSSGTYHIQLTSSNECGSSTTSISLDIFVDQESQIPYTAKDQIPSFEGHFRPGANIDFFPLWSDEQLADIAAGNPVINQPGAGVKSLKTILPHYFLDFWGYDIRQSTFEYYNNLDLRDNVVTIGFPSASVQDSIPHCAEASSTLFKNLYQNIWDNGENGTPVNESNDFALYLYHTVNNYKDHVQFWEIMSGPDFDPSGEKGWLPPGEAGNWWEADPDPCDYALHAPIQYYVRMLRISYEIIKSLDPEAYVTISGIGFPSFLDAVLRNSDNPIDGSIVPGYPHRGGAYFDAIGYSVLPHFDGSTIYYDINVGDFVYERHSDAAIRGVSSAKSAFEIVLQNYGYDGTTYPEKQWYVSSSNIPRKSFADYIGSEEAHRNYIIKAYVESIRNHLNQFYVRQLAETAGINEATDPLQLMGLYKNLENTAPYNQQINQQGIALKTTSDLLFCTEYDSSKTAALELPDNIDGAAFVDANHQYTYVLWAKTMVDQSEFAEAVYSFPGILNISQLYRKDWDFSATNENQQITGQNITLSSTPVFLTEAESPLLPPLAQFSSTAQSTCPGESIAFSDASLRAETWQWTFEGGTPGSSNEQNPTVNYNTPGTYEVKLEVSNAAGNHTAIYSDYIEVGDVPSAGFNFSIDGPWVSFTNMSAEADSYFWDFGDNTTGLGFNPEHFYFNNGTYDVRLVAFNHCGSDTITQTLMIGSVPQADFKSIIADDCAPYTVHFLDESTSSPNEWHWTFEGASPTNSNLENPSVVYNQPGWYPVSLIVSNEYGMDTFTQTIALDTQLVFEYSPVFCEGDSAMINGTTYSTIHPNGTEVLSGAGINGCDSVVIIHITNGTSSSELYANICQGENYQVEGQVYTEAGIYEITTTNTQGCDSLITLELLVESTYLTEIQDSVLQGEVYTVGNSTYGNTGFYIDTLMASNGCDSIIHLDLYVEQPNAIPKLSSVLQFNCFPNPFKETLHITFELNETKTTSLVLFDVLGTRVETILAPAVLHSGRHHYLLDKRDLAKGVYFLKVQVEENWLSVKVVHL